MLPQRGESSPASRAVEVLCDLDSVGRCPLPQVVRHNPKVQAARMAQIAAQSSHKHLVLDYNTRKEQHRSQRQRPNSYGATAVTDPAANAAASTPHSQSTDKQRDDSDDEWEHLLPGDSDLEDDDDHQDNDHNVTDPHHSSETSTHGTGH